ncbi:MAG: hypothetical protein K9G70_09860 [Prolixibacteraceae bacterium]|nr:hypothetical protein [Prolixibacteraceae bacterium]
MKNKFLIVVIIIAFIVPLSVVSQNHSGNSIYQEKIDFSLLKASGLISRQLKNISPSDGCVAVFDLVLPEINKGVVNEASINGWVSGYATFPNTFTSFRQFEQRTYESIPKCFQNSMHCGYYMLLELKDGKYLSILPIVANDIMAYLSLYEGKPQLKLCTQGTDTYTGKAPLFSWAIADDPYSATHKCWENALNSEFCKENVTWRSQKKYPELYEYLGWCTWEAFEGSITEEIVVNSINEIKKSPVPVRWVIVDDGYLDQHRVGKLKPQLLSFGTNKKFPNGWKNITSLKDENSVKWIGIWRNMSGGMYGVSLEHTMTDLEPHLTKKMISATALNGSETKWFNAMVLKPGTESSEAFYNKMTNNTVSSGFDFQKVDFQTFNFWTYSGTGNAVLKAHQNNQALENTSEQNNIDLLNCISQSNVNVFNTKHSIISRASVDIKLHLSKENMRRTRQSFANNMWWGEILVGDFDMYHTSNKEMSQYLTIARAISGGPVYVSDEPTHFDNEVISPVIFNDGKIIRALAPAVPLPKSLFTNGNNSCYSVIAPGRHKSCAIAAFNFSETPSLKGTISKDDYTYAPAKMQPYEGLWSLPNEGLVLYDRIANTGTLLDKNYSFSVERMKGKLFNLAPIQNGWAVIGRADKYIGGCTYTIESSSKTKLQLTLDESGPIIVYNTSKKIKSSKGSVKDIGNGFYQIDLPVGELNKRVKISVGN